MPSPPLVALGLAHVLGMSADFWIGLQHDLWVGYFYSEGIAQSSRHASNRSDRPMASR